MMQSRWIFWHRRDLRINDNIGLELATSNSKKITGLFIFDPFINLGNSDIYPDNSAKKWFLVESLIELKQSWKNLGSRLIILKGEPIRLIPRLASMIRAEVISWNKDIEPYTRQRDSKLIDILKANGHKVYTTWDQILVKPEDIKNGNGIPYRVFTPFYKKWKRKVIEGEEERSQKLKKLKNNSLIDLDSRAINELKQSKIAKVQKKYRDIVEELRSSLTFNGAKICPCLPGEAAALLTLKGFNENRLLVNYSKQRDFPFIDGTSTLSSSLNLGTISPRKVWEASQIALCKANISLEKDSIATWSRQLAWRDFYQHALFNYPKLVQDEFKESWKNFPWVNDKELFECWKNGLTGIPIIDASMRQLNQTGWMHNRCRMIVASFLVKDLICDWRWGESIFMQLLVDADLSANNGGWQWSASTGMDPKPLRIFNPSRQAQRFDPQGLFIRKWIPELRHVANKELLSGEIDPLKRGSYPKAVIEHKSQQKLFKLLYSTIKP